jgi:hypothetical protein
VEEAIAFYEKPLFVQFCLDIQDFYVILVKHGQTVDQKRCFEQNKIVLSIYLALRDHYKNPKSSHDILYKGRTE